MKIVDRNLRGADIKQLLTYCALNNHSRQYQIEHVAIVNPRRGIEHHFALDSLCERVAHQVPGDLFNEITRFLEGFDLLEQPGT